MSHLVDVSHLPVVYCIVQSYQQIKRLDLDLFWYQNQKSYFDEFTLMLSCVNNLWMQLCLHFFKINVFINCISEVKTMKWDYDGNFEVVNPPVHQHISTVRMQTNMCLYWNMCHFLVFGYAAMYDRICLLCNVYIIIILPSNH